MIRKIFSMPILLGALSASHAWSADLPLSISVSPKLDQRVSVSVKNRSDQPITYVFVSVVSNKLVRVDLECPCTFKCNKDIEPLLPGKTREYNWDLLNDQCGKVETGEFWIDITGRWDSNLQGNIPLGRSSAFVVE